MSDTEIEDLYKKMIKNLNQYDYYMQLRRDNKIADSQNNVLDITNYISGLFYDLDEFGLMLDDEKKNMERYGIDEYVPFLDVYKNRSSINKRKLKSISLNHIYNNLIPGKIQIIDRFIKLETRNLDLSNYLNSEKVIYYEGLCSVKELFNSSELEKFYISEIVKIFLIECNNYLDDNKKNEIKSLMEKYNNDGDKLNKNKLLEYILDQIKSFDKDSSLVNLFDNQIRVAYYNNSENNYVVENVLFDFLKQKNLQYVFDKLRKNKKIKIFTYGSDKYYCINRDLLDIIDSEINSLNINSKELLDLRIEKQQNDNELQSLRNSGYNCSSDLTVLHRQKSVLENRQNFAHTCLELIPKNEHYLKTIGNRLYPMSGQANNYKKKFFDLLIKDSKKTFLSIDNDFVNGNIKVNEYINYVKNVYIDSIRDFCNISMLSIVGKGQKVIDESNNRNEAYINEFLIYINDFTNKLSQIHLKHEDELKEKISESLNISERNVKTKNPIKKINVFFKSFNKKKLRSQRLSLIGKVLFDTMLNNGLYIENGEIYKSIDTLLKNNSTYINSMIDESSKIK